ncbi:hypothetical protein ASZ90_004890 [hydrocarbon metagenome]|uniref:Uncharacterized protein n=1 Tax=hydrocarbon metagenome TaxID=938273 RepID=A0A0W8FWJ3_9ZZZZ
MELITPMDGEVLGIIFQDEIEIDEPKNDLLGYFISRITKKKKDKDWDEAVGDLKKKKDYDWDEAVGDLKKKKDLDMDDAVFDLKKEKDKDWDETVGDLKKEKDKDWDETVGDLKKKKDKDWDEAVGDLKKKKDKDWDEAVGDLKKKKDYDWDEAVGDLKKKKDYDWDEAVGDLKKKKDMDWDEAVGDFKKKIDNDDDRYIEEFKGIVDRYFDLNADDFNSSKSLNKDRSVSKTIKTNKNIPTIIFSWLPPVPVPPDARINYRLKLVEIYGNQSVHSAMASNPIYYQSLKLSATLLRYPVAAKPLMPGNKYAWSVEAFIDDFKIQESEIRSFEIQGGEDKKIRYDASNAGTVQFAKNIINENSGLPSGLASYTKIDLGAASSNYLSSAASIDLFGSDGNFIFSGDAEFNQTSSHKLAQYSQLPTNYRSLEINPRLSVYEIPVGMNIYLSSLNDPNRQSLNNFSFIFDIERLKSKIKDRISERTSEIQSSADSYLSELNDLKALADPADIKDQLSEKANEIKSSADTSLGKIKELESLGDPDKIKKQLSQKINEVQASADSSLEKLKEIEALSDPANLAENAEQLGLISSAEKIFLDIKTLGLGRTYPEYSDFTVSGVPVNGLNIEYNPGILYLAFAAGNNAVAIENVSLKRTFISGRLGLGKKENSHLIFTLLKMKDDYTSASLLTPQENVVFGTDVQLNLSDNLINISGEGAVSGFTRDLNDADYESDSVPEFVKKIIVPKLSTSFDYAWKGNLEFNNEPSSTNFKFGVRRIGPGFTSLASPNLRQDQLQYDFNFVQKFAKKKITLKTFFKTYSDNLIDWKQSTTSTTSYGINLGFNFPDLPFLQLNYSPYKQKNDAINAAQIMENSSDMFSLTTGYSYQVSGMFASTIISFNGQWQKSKIGINATEFSNTTYMLNQNLSFEFPLTLSFTSSISKLNFLSIPSSMTEFNLNGDYQINENISANLGGTISNEENLTKRIMITVGSNINLYQWLRIQLQGNISDYKDLSGGSNNYTDSMMLVTVLFNW